MKILLLHLRIVFRGTWWSRTYAIWKWRKHVGSTKITASSSRPGVYGQNRKPELQCIDARIVHCKTPGWAVHTNCNVNDALTISH